jgi:diadenosine tetraphosphate (Ap4A) HIT family hydrolase
MSASTVCPLCAAAGGQLVWQGKQVRVIQVDDAAYPGYCRVIWQAHVREMSDLAPIERAHLWGVLDVVERTLRAMLEPEKVNLASLGNQVPHLHWHVIPRWRDDPHFPDPIWAAPHRFVPVTGHLGDAAWQERRRLALGLNASLYQTLQAAFPW